MAVKLQIFEILGKLKEFTGEGAVAKKIEWLKQNDTPTLRMILQQGFDPNVQYNLPEGDPPYKKNDAPVGLSENTLFHETRKLSYLWLVPSDDALKNLTNSQKDKLKQIEDEQESRWKARDAAQKELDDLIAALKKAQDDQEALKVKIANIMDEGREATQKLNRAQQAVQEIDNIAVQVKQQLDSASNEITGREQSTPTPRKLNIPKYKLEMQFIELLESLHQQEAEVLLATKNKTLAKKFAITKDIVKKAFPGLIA